ncbi:MAG: hypothetical protein AAFR59_04575, partial [Bacteroidota bacterium]
LHQTEKLLLTTRAMKHVLTFALILGFIGSYLTLQGQVAQQSQVLDIVYLKSKTAHSAYIKLETELWKPLHEARVTSGEMTAWYLFEVTYPYGSNRDYDFVAINVFPNQEGLKNQAEDSLRNLFRSLNPTVDVEEIFERTYGSRELVKGEVFSYVSGTPFFKIHQPADFVQVNFMRVLEVVATRYENLEKIYALPLHTERVKAGDMQNWSLLKRSLPRGVDYPYQYITVDEYSNWDMLTKEPTPGLWQIAHGEVVEQEIWAKFLEMRDLVRQETWRLVSYVHKENAVVKSRGQ